MVVTSECFSSSPSIPLPLPAPKAKQNIGGILKHKPGDCGLLWLELAGRLASKETPDFIATLCNED